MCSTACTRASTATQCLERPGCGYCSRYPNNPTFLTATIPRNDVYGMKYDKVAMLGGCAPAMTGTSGANAVADLRAVYDQMVLSGDDAVGSADFPTFSSYYTCTGSSAGSVADAGRATARQSAVTLAQAQFCGVLTLPGACTLQRGCGWCTSTSRCVAYAPTRDYSAYDFAEGAACPSATPYSSLLLTSSAWSQFDSFCAPLAAKGCRTCAAAGCRYCHTTNMCHNSTAPASVCPALTYTGGVGNTIYVTNGDAGRCDYFCEAARSTADCSLCLASKHCAYCMPPAPSTFGYLPTVGSYSGISSRTYGCRPVNTSALASDYSDAMSNAASVCGWQAGSGALGASLSASNGYPTAVVAQTPIAGGAGNAGVCPASLCAGLSPAKCLFSPVCSLCGQTTGSKASLLCLPTTSSVGSACSAAQGGASSQVAYGGRSSASSYFFTLQQIYPDFCADVSAGAAGPAASTCVMSMGLCGWCLDRQRCSASSYGDSPSPAAGTCNATVPGPGSGGARNFIASRRSSGGVTPASIALLPRPATCEAVTDEADCLSKPACGWCSGNGATPGYPRCLAYDGGAVGYCAGGWINPGEKPGSLVASCLDLSGYCDVCLAAGAPGSGANVTVVDGPCGYCATSSACFPGNPSGPALAYPPSTPSRYKAQGSYPLTCTGKAVAWRFGGPGTDGYAQCAATPASTCARLTTCESCAVSNDLGCQWCLGSSTCVADTQTCPDGGAAGSLSYLDPDPLQSYSIATCPSFCRTQSLPQAVAGATGNCSTCLMYKQCGFCSASGLCLQGNASGPLNGDAQACPSASTSMLPAAGTPAGSAPMPGWLYGYTTVSAGRSVSTVPSYAFGFCPATCAMMASCGDCIAVPGCGWARTKGSATGAGRCIPGNATYGPFTAGAVAPEDWFPDSCYGPCGYGSVCATEFSGCSACTTRWGCGYCHAPGCTNCLPADPANLAAGPVSGACKSVWIAGSGSGSGSSASTAMSISATGSPSPARSCFSLYNGGGSVSPANYTALDPLVTQCDGACLLGGFSLAYTSDGDGSPNGDGNITITPFKRSIQLIPGCRCLVAVVRFSGFGAGVLARWGGLYPAAALSTRPSQANMSFTLGYTASYEVSGGLGSYKLFTSVYGAGGGSSVAYFWLRGCSATVASPVCYGAATFLAVPGGQSAAGYADACTAACARESFSMLWQPSASYGWQPFSPQYGTALRVPAVSSPSAANMGGSSVDPTTCSCRVAGGSAGCSAFPGSASNTLALLVRSSGDPSSSSGTGVGLGPGKTANANPSDYMTRFAGYGFPSLAEGGYAPSTLTGCTGATTLCKRIVDAPSVLPTGAAPAPTPIPTPTPAAAAAGVVVSYGAAVRPGNTLSDNVDDCTYACLLAGFNVVLDAAAPSSVQFVPAAAAPQPGCACRTLVGSVSGRTASGSFTSASGASYTFLAAATDADRVSLTVSGAGGAALGAASYDAAGCSNATAFFCGRVPSYGTADSSSGMALGPIVGGAVGAVLLIAGVAALVVFVIKPALAAKGAAAAAAAGKASAAAAHQPTIQHSNPLRSGV